MSYIGNSPTQSAFVTDLFNGTGSTTAFTMSVSPANPASILVAVSGVLQSPDTYSISGQTLNFSAAPPSATGNISVRYLGIPASGVTTTAYRTLTEFTATAGQTTFTPPSYTVGFISVYRNGVMLGSADYTATNGTSVVLASGASAGDLVVTESFYVSSVLNAIPATANSVIDLYVNQVTGSKIIGLQSIPKSTLPTGSVLQVVNALYSTEFTTASISFVTTNLTATITPTSSTSKILIVYALGDVGCVAPTDGAAFALYKNGSAVGQPLYSRVNYNDTSASETQMITAVSGSYYDSPSSTSALTYAIYVRNNASGGVTTKVFRDGTQGSITLMEIAA
jgi:hypothetical protein